METANNDGSQLASEEGAHQKEEIVVKVGQGEAEKVDEDKLITVEEDKENGNIGKEMEEQPGEAAGEITRLENSKKGDNQADEIVAVEDTATTPLVLESGSRPVEGSDHTAIDQVDPVSNIQSSSVDGTSETTSLLQGSIQKQEMTMPAVQLDISSENKGSAPNSVKAPVQTLGNFGFLNKLSGLRVTSSSMESWKGTLETNPAITANAKEIMKGAEKFQETAKSALNNFFTSTTHALSDLNYDKVPVVDVAVDKKSGGGLKGSGGVSSHFGSMWKQISSRPLASVGVTNSLDNKAVTEPKGSSRDSIVPVAARNADQSSSTETASPSVSKEVDTTGQTTEITGSSPLKSEDLPAVPAMEQKGEASDSDSVTGLTPSQSQSQEMAKDVDTIAVKIASTEIKEQSSESGPAAAVASKGTLELLTQNILDGSKTSLKALQTRARHIVSQNKRRYQEGDFDLDMTYITENIIAMGFPGGDISSGIIGYVEGFYRNHMEDVIRFLETKHKEKYKVYNLCAERLYDPALFEGKVAAFGFEDHNCPPLSMMMAFCESCYDWLKGGLDRVVVVHCKAGLARTGLMICCLMLYTKVFLSVEQAIEFYNTKRTTDGKALTLPSQLRYVHYFQRILNDLDSVTPPPRKYILRGIRLHKCPYWVRPSIAISSHSGVIFSSRKHPSTSNLLPEDMWRTSPRKGVVIFALPGERYVTELSGDFKISFQDRYGEFHCWLNTNMMQNRQILGANELDGFEKRRLGSPGFQVEVVVLDHDAPLPIKLKLPPHLNPKKPSVFNKPLLQQTPTVLSHWSYKFPSASANAFQALVGGGSSTERGKGEKRGSISSQTHLHKGNGTNSVSGDGLGGAINTSESSQTTRGMVETAKTPADKDDDIFSDSDEEEEKGGEAENKRERGGGSEGNAGPLDSAGGAVKHMPTMPTLGFFANALSSSVKDLGDGLNAMGGARLRNAMDSFRIGGATTVSKETAVSSVGSLRPSAVQESASNDEKKSTDAEGRSNATLAAAGMQTDKNEESGGSDSSKERSQSDNLGATLHGESSARELTKTERASGKATAIHLPPEAQLNSDLVPPSPSSDFKAVASSADMSVFTFGDDDEFDED